MLGAEPGTPALAAWLACLLVLAGCASRRAAEPPLVAPGDEGGLVVTLAWSAPVDLDLYVTTPRGESVYYANPRAAFERDSGCDAGGAPPHVERARWRSPASGRYRVGVDFPEACETGVSDAPYRIVVEVGGRRLEHDGTAHLLVRDPRALEVDVP